MNNNIENWFNKIKERIKQEWNKPIVMNIKGEERMGMSFYGRNLEKYINERLKGK